MTHAVRHGPGGTARTRRRGATTGLVCCGVLALWGCRLHVGRMDLERALSPALYDSIELGVHGRREVLARLGPPDGVTYTRTELVFDYEAASHRSTDLRFFLPTDALLGPAPLSILNLPRLLLDPFEEPEALRETTMERAGRQAAEAAAGLVPFTRGVDLLILRGRQTRSDRLRVVLDGETLVTTRKELRLATGEYAEQSLADRVLLRTD